MKPPAYIRAETDGVLLSVKLQPRSSRNSIEGPIGTELRIKVTAPPVDCAANEALVRFLAEKLECARRDVELVRGHTSRHKTLKISGLAAEAVARLLATGS